MHYTDSEKEARTNTYRRKNKNSRKHEGDRRIKNPAHEAVKNKNRAVRKDFTRITNLQDAVELFDAELFEDDNEGLDGNEPGSAFYGDSLKPSVE